MTTPTPDEICERLRVDAKWHRWCSRADQADNADRAADTIERLSAALVELRKHCHSETRQGLLSIIDAALGKDAS